MSALTKDTPLQERVGDYSDLPMLAAIQIYQGSVIGITSAGYARGFVLGDRFGGHTFRGEYNVNGASGDQRVRTRRGKYYLEINLANVSITDAENRSPVYVQDSGTYSLRVGQLAGHVVAYRSSGVALVLFDTELKTHVIAQTLVIGDFTDNDPGATGYVDLDVAIPNGAVVKGWQADVKTGFTGDTTAVIQVGEAGNLDRFTSKVDNSVFAAAVVGAVAPSVTGDPGYCASDTTVRVTVTGGNDFGDIVAGELDLKIVFDPLMRI